MLNIKTSNNEDEIFTGLCKEMNHSNELKFYCKTHNELCCAECITKIKTDGYGQHTDCEICLIKEIKDEKIQMLNKNIKQLEELSTNIKEAIKKIKLLLEKVDEDKEKLKIEIQNSFTKLRNELNKKEDEIFLQIDNKYEELFFDKQFILDIEKLPDKIDKSLQKGKVLGNINNDDTKLNSLINDCLNIEKNISNINKINTKMEKFNSFQNKQYFYVKKEDINQIMNLINNSQIISTFCESDIINKENFEQIKKWIGGNHDFILKYSAKRDGCNTDIFHQKCDNIEGSLFICKPKNNDIIGGYISTKILKVDKFCDDSKAFIFNLSQNFIRRNKKSYKDAIKNFSDSSFFIRFGNGCSVFTLSGNCLNDKNSYVTYCSCQTNFESENNNLFNFGQIRTNFQVENFEVFEVIRI